MTLRELQGRDDELGSDDSRQGIFSISESLLPFAGAPGARGYRIRDVTSHGPSLGWLPLTPLFPSTTIGVGPSETTSSLTATKFSARREQTQLSDERSPSEK